MNHAEPGVNFFSKGPDETGIPGGYFLLEKDEYISGFAGFARRIVRQPNKRIVTSTRLSNEILTHLWERIVLTPKEDMVLESLRILEPNLERIAFTSLIPEGDLLKPITDQTLQMIEDQALNRYNPLHRPKAFIHT